MMKDTLEYTSILGVRVDLISLDELIGFIISSVLDEKKSIITNVNIQAINIAYKDEQFKNIINTSDIVFCDGVGIKWTVKLLVGKKSGRYSLPDMFPILADECAKRGVSLYFLGAKPTVAENAAKLLIKKYPNLIILGTHDGYFEKTRTSPDNIGILKEINALHPDILVVGFGMPMQEKWIIENWDDLQVKIALPVGAMFDYLSGEVKRAPRWMTDNGLEWFGRLLVEPGRLWKRYIIGNPLFLWRIFIHHVLGFPIKS
jgi:N-acetylglucosaminyldiphosphoundecaprenol N-acetyl-beta-D-mannosaminyltransferase